MIRKYNTSSLFLAITPVLAACFAFTSTMAVRASVVVPYTNDFSSEVNEFTENGANDWTLDTVGGVYTLYKTGTAADYDLSALVEVDNLGGTATTDFNVTTHVNILQSRGSFGLAVLSDSASISNSASHYYEAELAYTSGGYQVHFSEHNGDANSAPPVDYFTGLGGAFDLGIEGTYLNNGSLRLVFTWTKNGNSASQTLIDATPETGQYFGLFARKQGSTYASLNIEADFDYLSITSNQVPEPSGGLLAISTLGMFVRFRRRPATSLT